MNSEIRSLKRVRDCLWNQHKVSDDQAIYKKIKIVRNQIVSKIRYSKHFPKWSQLMNVNKVITDDLTNANLLNSFFVSQSTLDESKAQLPQTHHTPSIQLIRKS